MNKTDIFAVPYAVLLFHVFQNVESVTKRGKNVLKDAELESLNVVGK